MKILSFNFLPEEAIIIRQKVFVEEQGFKYEFDEIDSASTHFVLFDDKETPIATCRVFFSNERNSFILGRLAVIKEHRGKNIGKSIVEEAEKHVQRNAGKEIQLHAQCRITPFYERLGFTPFGDIEYEEDCPHIWMKKEIQKA